ncbi:RHS repeat protein, partial [[Clostridium] clostridioforme]|nr:RHS repeat protein [Enterocloster clostridioformis]
ITFADGSKMKFAYDPEGALIKTTNPEGNSQTFEWNPDGTLARAVDEEGRETLYRYNEQKLVEAVINAKGEEISLGYDRHLNLSRITLPDGSSALFEYDSRGNCISETNPLGAMETYQYDALNRMVRAYLSDGNQVALTYDGYDDVLKAKDSQREVNFTYTILGSMTSRTQDGRTLRYHYDSEEQLVSVTNEKGETWEFERDVRGNVIKEVQYGGQTYEYKRDYSGLITKIRRPGGRYTRYQYDKLGQVIRTDYHDQSFDAFAYNKNGALIEAENQHVKVRLERDKTGQITKEWQDYDWAASEYDEAGNCIRTTSRFGADIRMERDAMGQVIELAAYHDNNRKWSAQMDYNRLGQETRRLVSGGVLSSFEYDKTGRPIQHVVGTKDRPGGGGEYRRRQYEWGINSQLKRVTNELSGGSIIYSYDSFGSLIGSKADQFEKLFCVTDEVGNLYGDTWLYAYYGNWMLKKVVKPDRSGVRFIYDPFGRRIEKAVSLVGSENALPKAETGPTLEEAPWVQVGGGIIRKPFNKKQDSNLDSGAEQSLYVEESLEPKTEYQTVIRFLWSGDTLLHEWETGKEGKRKLREREGEKADYILKMEEKADRKARAKADKGTEPPKNLITWVFQDDFIPRAKLTEDGSYSIISDYLGTPVEAYDEEGKKVWERELDIYGRVKRSQKDRFGKTTELVGEDGFIPFRYQGQYEDVETGLYYNRFRYYSPSDGCYTQVDPIGLAGNNPTLYGYVSNPTMWIDVFGLAGRGGAYFFEFTNGMKYIGKGEEGRMWRSVAVRAKQAGLTIDDLISYSNSSTNGNNELGKMVEYWLMKEAGFERGDIPKDYLNKILSGEKSWNANKNLQKQAKEIADKMKKNQIKCKG